MAKINQKLCADQSVPVLHPAHVCREALNGAPKSCEILMFVCNQVVKFHENLMFVCLQKDARQCCDATKLNCTHGVDRLPEQQV